ncbi:NAD-dependent epimerase/dehydratase family protein [Desulfoluna spongiiphila]|uniref:NAD-dependent epimerase/dehydratase family protein n=1 Tax=Desulfoluna spongiiphila TaxID=419481 RepID=UPI00125B5CBA|nr:NAD-dependent epimerase/dehydratase family protein [Desulfoluna spongiiphila]VVS90862.1 nucleotide-diphospho-sugar transferases [Desulfoluna spongiiphila]
MRQIALLTGATGFVGSHLCRRLLNDGWEVHAIVRSSSNYKLMHDTKNSVSLHTYDGSIQCMQRIVAKSNPIMIFHLASLFISRHDPTDIDEMIKSNITIGTHLADAAIQHNCLNFINTGTSWQHYQNETYNPVNLYAATKQAFEDILKYYSEAYKLKVITLKLFDTYGPDDPRPKLMNLLQKAADTGQTLDMSPGDQLVDLVYIDYVVDKFCIAADKLLKSNSRPEGSYGVGTGNPISIKWLVKKIETEKGKKINVNWGAIPYRFREVMVPWSSFEILKEDDSRKKIDTLNNICVAIPTCNRTELLEKLLCSIPHNIKISISDNGNFISPKVKNKNISYFSTQQIIPMFENWNNALRNIDHCKYVVVPSDDDIYYNNSFGIIENEIWNNPDIDIFIFGHNLMDENEHIISSYCPRSYKKYNPAEGFSEFQSGVLARMPSVVFKKTFLDKVGYFDESFQITAADSELIQRALLFGKALFVPTIISGYRVWSGGLTAKKIATKEWMDEIELWTNKTAKIAFEQLTINGFKFNKAKFKDEIFAQNLLAGLLSLVKAKRYRQAILHLNSFRFPRKARLITKLRLLAYAIMIKLKCCLK